ncbi:MAG: phosphoglycerol transferase MdoB-like AlkP superfamily enzyme [Bacteroidia bacterium]|jgi:phosphoglycerol transferase MdoB-like AlkP superfamily enzyme
MRLLFVLTNATTFTKINTNHLFDAFIFGFRLDFIVSTYVLTGIYLIYVLTKSRILATLLTTVFAFWASFIGLIDALYFKFLKERISYDFFSQLGPSNNISLWTYIKDYWPMALVGVAITTIYIIWVRLNFKTKIKPNWLSLLIIIALALFIARGGFRLKPLRTADTGQYLTDDAHVVAFNTTLYIYETWTNPISTPVFVDASNADLSETVFGQDSLIKPNFVIVILEGFGKEYTGLNRGMTNTYTPFLNSLISQSVCCHNAYANGLKSVDAVPAIFTGIPKLSTTAFIHSPHSTESRPSVFNLLEKIGYISSFFHGANNQTMGFQSYLKSNGLQAYYGIEEYPNAKSDFDGHWGIYDQPYLNYVKNKISTQTQPFLASVFTLSSHHPYALPDHLKDSFKSGDIPIHHSIQYSDYALQNFITSCESEPWFENTIFIITADHSAENLLHAYRTPSGKYEIPLLLYSPKLLPSEPIRKTVSHIDILPTILDIVNYPTPVVTLGSSIFTQNTNQVVCHFDNNVYHITKNNWNYGVSSNNPVFLYNKKKDINCLNNTMSSNKEATTELDRLLKQEVSKYFQLIK